MVVIELVITVTGDVNFQLVHCVDHLLTLENVGKDGGGETVA